MLTEQASQVDGRTAKATNTGLWLSLSDLALRRKISKQAISKTLKRWADIGTPVSTRKEGKKLFVNVAEFDRIKGEVGDLIRDQAPPDAAVGADPVFAREQARRMAYDADLKQLELDERLGKLVPIADVERAAVACGESMLRMFDQMASRAEDMATAVAKDGVAGGRTFLKALSRDLRSRCVEEITKLPLLSSDAAPAMVSSEN